MAFYFPLQMPPFGEISQSLAAPSKGLECSKGWLMQVHGTHTSSIWQKAATSSSLSSDTSKSS